MRWCEKHDVFYIFGLARNPVLERRIDPLMEKVETVFEATGEQQRLFDEIQYAAETWDRQRLVIMKAERLTAGPNTRFIVTNLRGRPQALYDQNYVKRGDMEDGIKEQQLMLFADRTSCHDFEANQFRLLLSSFAYVLTAHLRQDHLAGTELESAQVSTIRFKLFKSCRTRRPLGASRRVSFGNILSLRSDLPTGCPIGTSSAGMISGQFELILPRGGKGGLVRARLVISPRAAPSRPDAKNQGISADG